MTCVTQSGPTIPADELDEPGATDRLAGRFRMAAASKPGLLSSKGWRVVGKGFGLLSVGKEGRWLPAS